jgi:hypothetical protein
MKQGQTALERAFELAKSGLCTNLDDLKRTLRLEGFSTKQIVGGYLATQLRALMKSAAQSNQQSESTLRE